MNDIDCCFAQGWKDRQPEDMAVAIASTISAIAHTAHRPSPAFKIRFQ